MSAVTQQLKDTVIYKGTVIVEEEGKVEEREGWSEGAEVCLERARLITESYKQTEGEPEVLRRAKALAYILDSMTTYIRDGERIVGNFGSSPAGIPIFPELAVGWVDKIIKGDLTKEQHKLWRDICNYWDGKCLYDRVDAVVPDSLKDYIESKTNDSLCRANYRMGILHVIPNWEKVLRVGLNGIISEIEERLKSLEADLIMHPSDYVERKNFYEAALIACRAVVRFANRFAQLAREMAEGEPDEKRAKELKEIAEICQWVPANPARTLHEAMQSFWFTFLVNGMIETRRQGLGVRLDQLLYPFYHKDVDEGRIAREQAQELMEFLLVKFEECGHFNAPSVTSTMGGTMFLVFTIGGLTPDGRDATNEFSFIMLDAAIEMKTIHTSYGLRYHSKINPELIDRTIDLLRTGIGYPAFFNDSVAIPMMVDRGIPLEDARDYCIPSCVNWGIVGKNCRNHRASEGVLNLGKCLELALNQGRDMFSGKQTGCPTPGPKTFTSVDDVENAYFEQVKFAGSKLSRICNLAQDFTVRYMQMPFTSALVDGCIERGRDLNAWTYCTFTKFVTAGNTNVADSLAAIKKFVFDERKLTMKELVDVLKTDFEGKEELRQMLINDAPKFGNDDDYVDNIMAELERRVYYVIGQYKNWWGQPYSLDGSIAGGYYPWGKRTAATPDGRKARDSFADAVLSPMAGRDHKGPTAVINSMGKVTPYWPQLTNQKFLPQFLQGDNKKMFAAYLKTWADLGNYHIQFNIVDREALLDAQVHPEKYRNLTIRVAGYSAYFVDLSKGVQDDIIARVSQSF